MFNAGDVVELRSGGTKMTVEAIEGNQITCVWTTASGSVKRDTFDAALLKDANEQKVNINIIMGEKSEP